MRGKYKKMCVAGMKSIVGKETGDEDRGARSLWSEADNPEHQLPPLTWVYATNTLHRTAVIPTWYPIWYLCFRPYSLQSVLHES